MVLRMNPALPAYITVFLALAALGGLYPKNATAAAVHRRDPSLAARKEIQAIYDKENAAAAHKDIHGVFAEMAPDFSEVDDTGQKISLAEIKANLADLFSHATTVKGTTTIQKFRLIGRTAIVTTKSRDEMTVADPEGEQARTITIDDLSVDTWVRSGKVWLQKHSRDVSQSVHTDEPNPMLS
jgi:hypothetical protein